MKTKYDRIAEAIATMEKNAKIENPVYSNAVLCGKFWSILTSLGIYDCINEKGMEIIEDMAKGQ